MPKRMERKIVREYRRKGFSLKRSRSIAYATMQKRGLAPSAATEALARPSEVLAEGIVI